jgi:chromate transport protein ChrA
MYFIWTIKCFEFEFEFEFELFICYFFYLFIYLSIFGTIQALASLFHIVRSVVYVLLLSYMAEMENRRNTFASYICQIYHISVVFFSVFISLTYILSVVDRYLEVSCYYLACYLS